MLGQDTLIPLEFLGKDRFLLADELVCGNIRVAVGQQGPGLIKDETAYFDIEPISCAIASVGPMNWVTSFCAACSYRA